MHRVREEIGEWLNGRSVFKQIRNQTYIFENTLKNGNNNMCHMLIFVKSKNNYF